MFILLTETGGSLGKQHIQGDCVCIWSKTQPATDPGIVRLHVPEGEILHLSGENGVILLVCEGSHEHRRVHTKPQ